MSEGMYNSRNPWNSGQWVSGQWYPYNNQAEMAGPSDAQIAESQRRAVADCAAEKTERKAGMNTNEISEDAMQAIRYALRVAKAMDEIALAQADLTYDKERMSEIQRRIESLDKAIEEVA